MFSAIDIAEALDACDEGIEWLEAEESFQEAWARCHRGDWMLWVAAKLGVDIRHLTLAKVRCAATVKHLMKDERSLKTLEVAEKFGLGIATKDELNAVTDAADAAVAAAYAYAADNDAARKKVLKKV